MATRLSKICHTLTMGRTMTMVRTYRSLSFINHTQRRCESATSNLKMGHKVFKNGPSKICGRQPFNNWSDMVCLSRAYHFKFCKGCLPQIFLGPFLNTLPQIQTEQSSKISEFKIAFTKFATYSLARIRYQWLWIQDSEQGSQGPRPRTLT